jgi:glutaryl-CoA dehydrogenase
MSSELYDLIDPLGSSAGLTDAELVHLARLRHTLDTEITPLIPAAWEAGQTPESIRPTLAGLRLVDPPDALGPDGHESALYQGFRTFELARCDLSVQILFNGHASMFRTLIRELADPDVAAEWDRKIADFELTGCFALTEPDHGSDVAGGLETTAVRDGDSWVINGAKKWIGNAAISDFLMIIARTEDGIGGFLVPRETPGVRLDKIEGKIAVRMVNNAQITLSDVRVPDSARLPRLNTFADINRAMRGLRADVVWTAAGMQAGILEAARSYATERVQFGRPIGGFQLVQEKLARILSNLASTLAMAETLTRGATEGVVPASLAKLFAAQRLRDSAALGREIGGGNGVLLEHHLARFFADAEGVYTFEGTHEVNSLIVGRHLTGIGAFH